VKQQITPYAILSQADTIAELHPLNIIPAETNEIGIHIPYNTSQNTLQQHTVIESSNIALDTLQEQKNVIETYNDSISFVDIQTSISLTDSITTFSTPTAPKVQSESVQPSDKTIIIRYNTLNDTSNNWIFWILLCSFAIISWLRIIYKKQFSFMFRSAISCNFALKSLRQNKEFSDSFSSMLTFVFSLHTALFAFQAFTYTHSIQFIGWEATLYTTGLFVAVLCIYGIKDIFIKFIGFIFLKHDVAYEYMQNVHLYNRITGVLLFPIIISLAFIASSETAHNALIITGISLFAGMYMLRIFRGFQISKSENVSILYMFLYFCTLEVLPLALVIKLGIVLNALFY